MYVLVYSYINVYVLVYSYMEHHACIRILKHNNIYVYNTYVSVYYNITIFIYQKYVCISILKDNNILKKKKHI